MNVDEANDVRELTPGELDAVNGGIWNVIATWVGFMIGYGYATHEGGGERERTIRPL